MSLEERWQLSECAEVLRTVRETDDGAVGACHTSRPQSASRTSPMVDVNEDSDVGRTAEAGVGCAAVPNTRQAWAAGRHSTQPFDRTRKAEDPRRYRSCCPGPVTSCG